MLEIMTFNYRFKNNKKKKICLRFFAIEMNKKLF